MPDRATHLTQAAHNEAFFGEIDGKTRSDWAVTVLFYAAVHYVDAYLATKQEHPPRHEARRRCLLSHPTTKPLFNQYERLQKRSEAARYDAVKFSELEIESLRVKDLGPIKAALG